MIKILYRITFIGLIFFCLPGYSQQDAQFSQYMFNTIYYNPAFAGVEGVTQFTGIFRSQWTGYRPNVGSGGAPTTQVFSINTPFLRLRSGFAFHAVNESLGPLNNQELQISYAYHIGLPNAKLSLGVRSGVFSQAIDFNKYIAVNPSDPLLQGGKESQLRPDLAVGVFYRGERIFGGLSYNHILKAEFDFGINNLRNSLTNHMYLTAGYDYQLNYNFVLTPTVLVKTDLNTYIFDVSLMGTYNNKIWGGVSFRQSDAAIALLGYSLLKDNSLRVGYSFDYIIRAQEAKEPTSHEIMLSYTMPVVAAGGRKIVRTPRFRH
ncbi:type IX secretion system membrane protein PorP/SprF [soil metagenome]